MRFNKSNLVTIAAAGLIVALSGGTGAYAATQINGDSIKDNTIDASELQRNAVTSADVAPDAIKATDLAPNSVDETVLQDDAVTEELTDLTPVEVETLKQGSGLDSNGDLVNSLTGSGLGSRGYLPAEMGPFMLTVNVTGASQDTEVTVTVGDDTFRCVAVKSESFDGTCSVTGLTNGAITGGGGAGQVEVSAVGDQDLQVALAATRG